VAFDPTKLTRKADVVDLERAEIGSISDDEARQALEDA